MSAEPTPVPTRGYVPGVFDMFHVGHLNLIRAARPYCDHLIVGVATDEVVERVKGRPPVVTLRERMEIVGAPDDIPEHLRRHAIAPDTARLVDRAKERVAHAGAVQRRRADARDRERDDLRHQE